MFRCDICSFNFKSLVQYDHHLRYHRNNRRALFKCLHGHCNLLFKTYKCYKMHIFRIHKSKNINRNETNVNQVYQCNIDDTCNNIFNCQKDLVNHICNNHLESGQQQVKCPLFNTCGSKTFFKEKKNLKMHFYRKHNFRQMLFPLPNTSGITENNVANDVEMDDTVQLETDTSEVVPFSELPNISDYRNLYEMSIKLLASIYLNLTSKYFVSEKALQIFIDGMFDLNELNNMFLMQEMNNHNITLDQNLIKNNLFEYAHNSSSGILRSYYSRKQFYKTHFNFVEPICVKFNENKSFFYYIPIFSTIEALFKNQNFLQQFFLSHKKSDKYSNSFFDICDGTCLVNNSFFIENPNAIKILLYHDAFEICNPLGSAKTKYKIVGIYMLILNLPPWHRSRVEQIQLVALVYEKHIKTFGFSPVINKITKDLKILESNGINISIKLNDQNVETQNLKGVLVAVCADNLGSHQIGGFNENFHLNGYFCRYCYIHHATNETINMIHQLRTKNSYCDDVNMSYMLNESVKGVKFDSALNELQNFHVCENGLPPCIAHDLFEGVVDSDLMLCINDLVSKKLLTLDEINSKYQTLQFTAENKIFLPLFKQNNKIKLPGSATENMWFMVLFPFVVLENVAVLENEIFEMILLLRKIVLIIVSFELSQYQLIVLQNLIEEYIEIRRTLFPTVPLKPKHHFMCHYAFLIKTYGPLRHLWTLRFESKHQYFKNIVKHTKNYKNVLQSLSYKHQLLQSLNLSQELIFSNKVITTNSEAFTSEDLEKKTFDLIKSNIKWDSCVLSKCVEFRGITYKIGSIVCLNQSPFGGFNLCKIKYILISKDFENIYFIGKNFEVVYNSNIGLYNTIENSKAVEKVMTLKFSFLSIHLLHQKLF